MIVDAGLKLFADYFQIYLADPSFDDDWSDGWAEPSAMEDRFVVRPQVLVFATERNFTVPVRVVGTRERLRSFARAFRGRPCGQSRAADEKRKIDSCRLHRLSAGRIFNPRQPWVLLRNLPVVWTRQRAGSGRGRS